MIGSFPLKLRPSQFQYRQVREPVKSGPWLLKKQGAGGQFKKFFRRLQALGTVGSSGVGLRRVGFRELCQGAKLAVRLPRPRSP